MENFLVISRPVLIPNHDNDVKLVIWRDGEPIDVLNFPGPNGKLDADIAFRRLWAEEIKNDNFKTV